MKKKKEEKICTLENYSDVCPLYDSHDKLEESFHFLLMMAFSYHKPDEFRFNLDAFLQSLRSVTWMLQKDKTKIPNFHEWYADKQNEMIKNPCLKKVSDTRTTIVHKHSLRARSKVDVGLYRGRKQKLCISFNNIDPFLDSKTIFNKIVPQFAKIGFIDKEHSAIDEQLGIKREWYSDELGEDEILKTCYEAYLIICEIMREAHSILGYDLVPQAFPDGFVNNVYVLLESDFDPNLPKKWGWCD